jgi:hypothetical protein
MRNEPGFKKAYSLAVYAVAVSLMGCGGGGDSSGAVDNFPSRDSKYNTATNYYGALVVKPGEIYAETATLPWTGYWLPTNSTYMFQHTSGQDYSPLEKYDMYMSNAHNQKTTAAQTEHDTLYNPLAGPADGHCDAWSIASIYENDPTPGTWSAPHNSTLNGVSFTPADLKALLVDTYENQNLVKMIGERYDNLTDDPNDMYPDQFQAVVQGELFNKARPFIIDRDPGPEVWNTPVESADIQTVVDSSNPQLLHVTAYIGTINAITEFDEQDPNWQGNPNEAEFTITYTYDLYGDQQADGSYVIKSGVWTGDSVGYHPDFALVKVDGNTSHQSLNPQVSNDMVYEIISRAQQVSK